MNVSKYQTIDLKLAECFGLDGRSALFSFEYGCRLLACFHKEGATIARLPCESNNAHLAMLFVSYTLN